MSFNFFGFGRKTRRSKSVKTSKPSKTLVKLCKKYNIKISKKVGSKRVYKKTGFLKKQCAKKIRSLIKRHHKFGAKGVRRGRKTVRRTVRRTVVSTPVYTPSMPSMPVRLSRRARLSKHLRTHRGKYTKYAKRAAMLAAALGAGYAANKRGYVNKRNVKGDINYLKHRPMGLLKTYKRSRKAYEPSSGEMSSYRAAAGFSEFGKRRRRSKKTMFGRKRRVGRPRKTSRRKVHRKSRRVVRRRAPRRYSFGYQVPLSAMMGNEFCSNGGGVLGTNSTGLYPTPCMTAAMPTMPTMDAMGSAPASAFGKRRRRSTKKTMYGRHR